MWKVFLIFATALWTITSKEIRLVCLTTSTLDCGSGFKFRVLGNDLDINYCLPQGATCTPGFENKVQTSICDYDYKYNPCSSGVCYYTVNQPVCSKDFGTCSKTPVLYSYECVDCAITNCSKCFIGYRNGAINTAQICLGETCGHLEKVEATVQNCPNGTDALGFECGCCASTNIKVSTCVSNNEALSLHSVVTWAKDEKIPSDNNSTDGNSTDGNATDKNSTKPNNTTSNWQFNLHTLIVLVIALAVALI